MLYRLRCDLDDALRRGDVSSTDKIFEQLCNECDEEYDNPVSLYGLCLAAELGYPDIVRLALSKYGADPNFESHFGLTPLHHVAACNMDLSHEDHKCEIINLLIDAGANVNRFSESRMVTPVAHAISFGNYVACRRLLQIPAVDVTIRLFASKQPLLGFAALQAPHPEKGSYIDMLMELRPKIDVNEQDQMFEMAALHQACFHEQYDNVVSLIQRHGADVTIRDNLGRTAYNLLPGRSVPEYIKRLFFKDDV